MNNCPQAELVSAYAMNAVPAGEVASVETHLASCAHCQRELQALRPVVDTFAGWPTDVLRPTAALQGRLALRIAEDSGAQPVLPAAPQWKDPEWEQVAPGISVKLLANDEEKHVVSMLVRLAPGGQYPAHTHAGMEELHLLEGELWIDDRKLHPGDYNLGRPGEGDQRVYSETGCTCLLITSTKDVLR
jgi:anti-sigma factor ChrR (cupin superfamily)